MSALVGNALPPVGAPSMLCWAHLSHSWNNCRLLCCRNMRTIPQHQAFSKKFKVSNTRVLSLTPCHHRAPSVWRLECARSEVILQIWRNVTLGIVAIAMQPVADPLWSQDCLTAYRHISYSFVSLYFCNQNRARIHSYSIYSIYLPVWFPLSLFIVTISSAGWLVPGAGRNWE